MNATAEPPVVAPHRKIYPRPVQGRFRSTRWIITTFLQAVLFLTPWITWHGRQAVLLDLAQRRFHFFGVTLFPQEMYLLQILLVSAAVLLFLSTAVGGRMFCGYACPQTLLSEMFIVVERWFEGAHGLRLDGSPWTLEKLRRKLPKYLVWGVMSVWLGITVVGYFTPVRTLPWQVFQGQYLGPVFFFAAAAWFDFGFFREQMCHYVCPYARFQGAMFDRDSLIVGYDQKRGEPRGKLKSTATGDCVDCRLCVQVCPMGIDIRKGLQFECIGCTACIDACDSVMDKIHKPRGLVRYSSMNSLEGKPSPIVRPRVVVYSLLLVALGTLFTLILQLRSQVSIEVLRGVSDNVFQRTADDQISNVYQVKLTNRDDDPHEVRLSVTGLPGARLVMPMNPVRLDGGASVDLRVLVVHPPTHLAPVTHLQFVATDPQHPEVTSEKSSSFLGPSM